MKNGIIKKFILALSLAPVASASASSASEYEQIRQEYESKIKAYCTLEAVDQKIRHISKEANYPTDSVSLLSIQLDDPSLPESFKKRLPELIDLSTRAGIVVRENQLTELESKARMLPHDDQKRIDVFYKKIIKDKCMDYWTLDVASLKEKAQQGHPEAKFLLGSYMVRGEGMPQDCDDGIKWLTDASEDGVEGASLALSKMYANGFLCNITDKEKANYYEQRYNKQ